jgi:hypothetical protein
MLDYLLLIVALLISCVSGFYSISGLVSIFSGAFIPVVLMGTVLELGKIILVLWLHSNWSKTKLFLKIYLTSAVFILMLITSIGIFGFLSRAHVGQSISGSEIQSKISIFDEQITSIKNEKSANQATLMQLDNAITQVISQSKDENGAAKALKIRNDQQKERMQINVSLNNEQEEIDKLQQTEAPLQLQLEKNEVDVGPIKYIAAMIFGDNPGKNLLERAVRYMIILLVAVFDPLAVAMLLASDLHKAPIDKEIIIPTKKKRKNKETVEKSEIPDKHIDDLIYKLSNEIVSVDELSEAEQTAILKKLNKQNNEKRENL